MNDSPTPPSLAELLSHADWVRGLARELVRDPTRVEDVVQDTWLAALRRPPRTGTNVRAWLAAVVRNVVRDGARARRRREFHEQQGAKSESLGAANELVDRVQLQHELSQHVLALAEPYRSVLLLRYFEGLQTSEAAARLGIPAATVRTREARAIERLREKLTRSRGGAEEWMRDLSGLVGALSKPAPTGTAGRRGWRMGRLARQGMVVGAVSFLFVVWRLFASGSSVELASNRASSYRQNARDEPRIGDPGSKSDRAALVSSDVERNQAASPTTHVEQGIVLDTHGRPVTGVDVIQVPADVERLDRGRILGELPPSPGAIALLNDRATRVRIDTGGRFELVENEGRETRLIPGLDGWVKVLEGRRVGPTGTTERVLVIERDMELAGEVVDTTGSPLAEARVEAYFDLEAIPTFPLTLREVLSREPTRREYADTAGRFTVAGVPRVGGLAIRSWKFGYRALSLVVPPPDSDQALRIVLEPVSTARFVEIEGRVVGPHGEGLAQATVRYVSLSVRTDAFGTFHIPIEANSYTLRSQRASPDQDRPRFDLIAVYPGLQPAILPDFGAVITDPMARTGLLLRLEKPSLAIRGVVLDDEGRPRPGVEIVLMDPTPMGDGTQTAEDTTGQDPATRLGVDNSFTDAAGNFEVGGLSSRAYQVLAVDRERCILMRSDRIPAGSRDVVLREAADAGFELVRGRVVSRGGRPMGGAGVTLGVSLVRSRNSVTTMTMASTRTGPDGRFGLARMPKDTASILVTGEGIDTNSVSVAEYRPGLEWQIAVPVQARFCVETTEKDPADRFSVLDAEGLEQQIVVLRKVGGGVLLESVPLEAARGAVCKTADTATTLVLFRGDEELRRLSIQLSADELRVLRP